MSRGIFYIQTEQKPRMGRRRWGYSAGARGAALGQEEAGFLDVEGDLGFQGVEGGEFLLGAEEGAECDFDVFAVEVVVEVEEVEFEEALA